MGIDYWREMGSYPSLYFRLSKIKKQINPVKIEYGIDKEQYFYHFIPKTEIKDKVIIWIHGGGWNSGSPKDFEFVGQCFALEGYHCISLGYRLSPKNKYPCQIEDACMGFNQSLEYLEKQGIDYSKVYVTGPSAGAHLASILCYSKKHQKEYQVKINNVKGFIGVAGPYYFQGKNIKTVQILLNKLFTKQYDRKEGEPYSLISASSIPMLLIHSKHDGLIDYSSSERLYSRAKDLGIECELYSVADKGNTHSVYSAGMFLDNRKDNKALDKLFSWIEHR